MGTYRTALGKNLDMSALRSKNERAKAVGNQKVNARGDTIDSKGNILVPVAKKVGVAYQRTVTNRAANIVKKKESGLVEADKPNIQDTSTKNIDDDFSETPIKKTKEIRSKEDK